MLCRMMSKLKVFKVTGVINKPNLKTPFSKEVLALKPIHAVEKAYAEIGSKHRVKRFQLDIQNVEEISPDEIENDIIKKIVTGE